MVMPKVTVTGPAVTPHRYGLASVVTAASVDRFELGGVEYAGQMCDLGGTRLWVDPCNIGAGPSPMDTEITGDLSWDEVDASTASVSVDLDAGGTGARDVAVAVSGAGQTVVRTGGGPTEVATGIGRPATPTVTVTDLATGQSTTKQITIAATGAGGSVALDPIDGLTGLKTELAAGASEPVYSAGTPFTVYAGWDCAGVPLDEARQTLLARLAQIEGRAVEQVFWDGLYGVTPNLRYGATATTPVRTTGIVQAVAALEDAASWVSYGGTPIIHAPRWTYPYAAAAGLAIRDRNVLATPAGTQWAFGTGYAAGRGPEDQDAEVVSRWQSWMYITGPIQQLRSPEPFLNPDGEAGFNRSTNHTELVAERTYVLTQDCRAFATLADLTPQVGGGGGGGGF